MFPSPLDKLSGASPLDTVHGGFHNTGDRNSPFEFLLHSNSSTRSESLTGSSPVRETTPPQSKQVATSSARDDDDRRRDLDKDSSVAAAQAPLPSPAGDQSSNSAGSTKDQAHGSVKEQSKAAAERDSLPSKSSESSDAENEDDPTAATSQQLGVIPANVTVPVVETAQKNAEQEPVAGNGTKKRAPTKDNSTGEAIPSGVETSETETSEVDPSNQVVSNSDDLKASIAVNEINPDGENQRTKQSAPTSTQVPTSDLSADSAESQNQVTDQLPADLEQKNSQKLAAPPTDRPQKAEEALTGAGKAKKGAQDVNSKSATDTSVTSDEDPTHANRQQEEGGDELPAEPVAKSGRDRETKRKSPDTMRVAEHLTDTAADNVEPHSELSVGPPEEGSPEQGSDAVGSSLTARTDGGEVVEVSRPSATTVAAERSPSVHLAQRFTARAAGRSGPDLQLSDAEEARLVHRVAKAFQTAQSRDGTLRLRLSPPELGSLKLEIKVQGGAMTARVEAETSTARTLLVDNLPALRDRLAEHNIRVEQFDVDLMDRQPGGMPDGMGGNRESYEQPAPNRLENRGGSPVPGTAEGRSQDRPLADNSQLNVIV